MAKRLKLKLSRVIPSLQFCRSKRSSAFAETPLPAIYRLSPVNPKAFDIGYPNLPAPPPSTPEHRFVKRNLSSKVISLGCSCRSGSCTQNDISSSPGYSWKKEAARWYVASGAREAKGDQKIYEASSDDDVSLTWVKQHMKSRRNNKMEKRRVVSVSSRDSGCFSSEEDEDEETETLVSSSRSFSNESFSELDRSMERTNESFFNSENKHKKKKANTNIKKIRRLRRYASKNYKGSNKTVPSPESPVRTSVLRRMTIPCTVEGKVRESVAVVKKSVDPYDDFKQSMWEMILEKQMFEVKDLEQLLQCFLSLNSRHYHGTIVEAFSEIWEVLFCEFPVKGGARVPSGRLKA